MKKGERKKKIDLLESLVNALGSSEGQTVEEIKQELSEEGIDVDRAINRLKRFQKKISEKSKEKYG